MYWLFSRYSRSSVQSCWARFEFEYPRITPDPDLLAGEAIGEGLEGGIIPACAEGGHIEDITDRHSTPENAAVSPELAAVEIVWCNNVGTRRSDRPIRAPSACPEWARS
jgi:hypothetical protein